MSKVSRLVIMVGEEGDFHSRIDAALRSDGTSPALDFLGALFDDACPDGQAQYVNSDVNFVHEYYRLRARMEHLLQEGVPQRADEVNHLRDGIWEVKGYDARMPYFDINELDGTHTPKPKPSSRADADDPTDGFWWYPEMDHILRITHGFMKFEQRTRPTELELALQIRREDLAHD